MKNYGLNVIINFVVTTAYAHGAIGSFWSTATYFMGQVRDKL